MDTNTHPGSNSLAIRRRNGRYVMLELNGHPGRFLHDDGITRLASPEALAKGIALCEKWNAEMIANKEKKEARLQKQIDNLAKKRYNKHIATRSQL